MSQNFIDQVRSIVMSNISDERFGVRELASTLGLSSTQTLRKVRSATGKSVNRYIRELRLEKAAKLIKKTDLTIAEISYQVGFGSPSYFNKAFVNYYGIAPGEYKTKSISLSVLAVEAIKNKHRETSLKMKIFYPVIIVLVFVIGYLLINNSLSKNTSFSNSIAVLPFKDMSPDDTQWFSDGVSYILEGSVTLYEDKIKINTQLINANDEHVWSQEYNESFDNVIAIQKKVAQEVMNKMQVTLSPDEAVTLEKYPTKNMEAYHLFLRGRLINDSRKVEDLKLNIELNKQAIALDSNYAEAYTEVAYSYDLLVAYTGIDVVERYNKAKYYVDKALKIDPNYYKAYMVKALLLGKLNNLEDWDKAKEYFEKAISLNPNDATIRSSYGWYIKLSPNPDLNNYLDQMTIAQRLNPFSRVVGTNFINALILNNKFKEAEEYIKKMGFLFSERGKLRLQSRIIAHKNKDQTKVIPFFKAKIEKDPNNSILYSELAKAYDGILNDDSTAIKFAKKAYEMDSTNFHNARYYIIILAEGKKLKEGNILLQSENFKSVVGERQRLRWLWYYYYHQENYKKALEVSKDSLIPNKYFVQVLTYAQLGDRIKVDSLIKNEIWLARSNNTKTFVYAILKERDSMYYYLEKTKTDFNMRNVNGRREFDPYRKEERFKAILRKHYFPVSSD